LLDHDLHFLVLICEKQTDATAGRGEFDRISHQVDQHPIDILFVEKRDARIVRPPNLDLQLPLGDQGGQILKSAPYC
jgi:hypothetical protein